MSVIQSLILGIVQGLAEFLPISSSGHLAVIQNMMHLDPNNILSFTVMLHFGTLIAIFVVYWNDIVALLKELLALIVDVCTGKGIQMNKNETRRLGIMIVISTIPTGVIGLLFNDFFESLYTSMISIGIGLIVTGSCLFASERWGGGDKGVREMTVGNALWIGLCQALAICPGISRSGATMVGGLSSKFNRPHAVRYAFLISIPSVLGAFIMEVPDAIAAAEGGSGIGVLIVGVIAAAISGYIAIKAMIRAVENKKLFYFSIYTWIVGIALVVYGLVS